MTNPSQRSAQDTAQDAKDTAQNAKNAAANVAADGKQAAAEVAQTGKQAATEVAEQTKKQASKLIAQTRDQLHEQAEQQRTSAVNNLRSLDEQLTSMTDGTDQDGSAVELAQRARDRVRTAADWLEHRDVNQITEELRRAGRTRPGAFLLTAAVAGIVAGRLTRGVVAEHTDDSPDRPTATGDDRRVTGQSPSTREEAPQSRNIPDSGRDAAARHAAPVDYLSADYDPFNTASPQDARRDKR
ncbi:MAG: hypothetical protein ABI206_06725 [Antricoccus sp.]